MAGGVEKEIQKRGDNMAVKRVKSIVLAFLFAWAERLLEAVWEGFWEIVIEGVVIAEERWQESDQGQKKKAFVQEKVMKYAEKHLELNWIYRQALRIFLSRVLDVLIGKINEDLGKDWVEHVERMERELRDLVPYI